MKDESHESKMEDKTIFFEASETVWWLDLTDLDPLIIRQIYATAKNQFANRMADVDDQYNHKQTMILHQQRMGIQCLDSKGVEKMLPALIIYM